jgi:hypothetical protein
MFAAAQNVAELGTGEEHAMFHLGQDGTQEAELGKGWDAAHALIIGDDQQRNICTGSDGAIFHGGDRSHGRHGKDALAEKLQEVTAGIGTLFGRQCHFQAQNCGFEVDILQRLFAHILLHNGYRTLLSRVSRVNCF